MRRFFSCSLLAPATDLAVRRRRRRAVRGGAATGGAGDKRAKAPMETAHDRVLEGETPHPATVRLCGLRDGPEGADHHRDRGACPGRGAPDKGEAVSRPGPPMPQDRPSVSRDAGLDASVVGCRGVSETIRRRFGESISPKRCPPAAQTDPTRSNSTQPDLTKVAVSARESVQAPRSAGGL